MDELLIISQYQSGSKLSQLAKQNNCTTDKIRWLLQKHNVWKPAKPHKCELPEQEIIDLYKQDFLVEEIASRYSVSVSPVVRILNKHNIRKPNKFKELSYKTYELVKSKKSFVSLVETHITQKNLMKALDCGQSMIVSLFKLHGIKLHSSGEGRSLLNQRMAQYPLTKDVVMDLQYNQNVCLTDIAKLTGVSALYLSKKCKDWKLPTISGSEIKLSQDFKKLRESDNIAEHLTQLVKTNTLKQLKDQYNVSQCVFSNLLKEHGVKFPIRYRSVGEQEVAEFIKSLIPSSEVLICDRSIIKPQELDIVIPNKYLAIEYCGLYWHSDAVKSNKQYHLDKMTTCNNNGFRLLTIFEDEWFANPDIIKTKIVHALGVNNQTKMHARQCIIKLIDEPRVKNTFLEQFHIQGGDKAKISLGLYNQDLLVAVMTFSRPSHLKGGKNKINGSNSWELNRFATNANYNVRGAAGKLLSHFKNNFDWNHIYSYADRRWSEGDLYNKLGFQLTSYSKPNYWYTLPTKNTREYRYNYKKSNLVDQGFDPNKTEWQIMAERGYYKIWDCGTIRFDMFRN